MKAIHGSGCLMIFLVLLALSGPRWVGAAAHGPAGTSAKAYLTTPDETHLLSPEPPIPLSDDTSSEGNVIHVDETQTFQQIDGFGASITDSTAYLLEDVLGSDLRSKLMTQIFDQEQGIGVSFLRQPLGSSDLSRTLYSFDDLGNDQGDDFSIHHDLQEIIPAIQAAERLNPKLKVMMTPWSPPGWMKTNGSMTGGGELIHPSGYGAFANYLVQSVEAYQAAGVPVYALTMQNEPLYENNYESMLLEAPDESTLLSQYVGPAFMKAGLSTKILLYDHNWDAPSYPMSILGDGSQSSAYASGSAFHCYAGDPSVMTTVHDAYPNKDVYVTECSTGTWQPREPAEYIQDEISRVFIPSLRNWAKTVVLWNLALDENNGPILPNSSEACDTCTGIATIQSSGSGYHLNLSYYLLGHFSKFIVPGAKRISSDSKPRGLQSVAFKNPDGSKVMIVLNSADNPETFKTIAGGESFSYTLPKGSLASFIWP
jgi:glucosylceramidase